MVSSQNYATIDGVVGTQPAHNKQENMNNIRKRIAAVFITVASIFGFAALSTSPTSAVRPSVVATSATDCSQSAFLGTRVCVDRTTPYGPVAFIYTSGTALYTSFPVSVIDVYPTAWTATPIEYQSGAVRDTAGNLYASLASTALPGPSFPQIVSGPYQGYMDWFANDASYEFVVTG